ncbi:MAG TPA: ABC transporter permease, partial [Fibrobacteria bacterium]|nr:ABC transporter permease [Fibrobacteria bacterium]
MPPLPLFLRLLRHKQSAWLSFVGIYSLGLSVFLVVNGLSRNFQEEIRLKNKELLEGEMRIESRRALTPKEQAAVDRLLPPETRKAEVWGFLSMLRAGGASRLVQVKAISPEYPLVGSFAFAGSARIEDFRSGEVLFPKELLMALKVGPGDTVKLGEKDFVVKDEYVSRPGGNFDFFELGSRIYIPLADMAATGLERKGSRIFRYRFYDLPETADAKALREQLEMALDDPEMEVSTWLESGSDLGRSFRMVTAFLKMLSLSAFLLAAVGAAFFFRHHLAGERRTVAVLHTLGCSRRRIALLFAAQNLALSALSAVVGALLARLWSQGLPLLLNRLYRVEVPSDLPLTTFLIGLGLAVATSLLFGVSGFVSLWRIPPGTLIKPMEGSTLGLPARAGLFLLQGAFFFVLAFSDSRSWLLSGLAVGSMGLSFLLLSLLGFAAFRALWALRHRMSYALRIILGSIRWGKERSLLAFAALGFVAFSTSLVPQLQRVLVEEIRVPKGRAIPQLFLFDIQEEQFDSLAALLAREGKPLRHSSPMVRARLEKVNGEPFRKARGGKEESESLEERNRREFRNRGFNLSYRDTLSDAETLVEGRFWTGPAREGEIPEISMEERFAQRLDLKVGDVLVFDVQGVEVEGRITSLRKVRWASFQPNFFVLFQPGALEEAPKSFLGTVAGVGMEAAEDLQNRVTEAFPNVTVLNLKEAIARMVETLDKLEWLVGFLSGFALLIGLAILWLIVDALVSEN